MLFHRVMVTGAAGFVGYSLAERLLAGGRQVVGIDSVNSYYDPDLKKARLERLRRHKKFEFVKADISDAGEVDAVLASNPVDAMVHLAAQVGVRYSIKDPSAYARSNIIGFMNVIEAVRNHRVAHLLYASSSSVYGANTSTPYSTSQQVDHPVSLYAASKKSNELVAHAYAHVHGIPVTGLRFFTVYGPWGRPDMAYFKFVSRILKGEPIQVYNHGDMRRDFTYIDDITEAVERLIDHVPSRNAEWDGKHPDPASSSAPYHIYNIGRSHPMGLMEFIGAIERELGILAVKEYLPMQPGDVYETYADVSDLIDAIGYAPQVDVEEGVARFVAWYREYFRV